MPTRPPTLRATRRRRMAASEQPLDLYVSYDYLPVNQHAMLALAVVGVNRAVLDAAKEYEPADLLIETIQTGESISVKFRQGKILPGWEFPDDDLVIVMPRWTAALFLTGSLLIGGAAVVEAGDVLKKKLESGDNTKQEQLVKEYYDLEQLTNPHDRAGQDLRRYLQLFENEIGAPNVSEAAIDGVVIRRRSKDDELDDGDEFTTA